MNVRKLKELVPLTDFQEIDKSKFYLLRIPKEQCKLDVVERIHDILDDMGIHAIVQPDDMVLSEIETQLDRRRIRRKKRREKK